MFGYFTKLVKTRLIMLVAVAPFTVSAEIVRIDRDVTNFDRVLLIDGGNLIVAQGDELSLTVEADEDTHEHIVTTVKNRVLTLELRPPFLKCSPIALDSVNYYLGLVDLQGIEISGSGTFTIHNRGALYL